jgi:pimeloyl-ACP methyl ester carboxylesterase
MPIAAGLYYFAHGAELLTRPPTILIHGAGGNHLYWPPQIRRMPNERVFAVDLPGHGKSQGVGQHTIGDYAESILAFMESLKLASALLVGHSLGGAVGLRVALEAPQRMVGLALIGSAARLRVGSALLHLLADPSKLELAVDTIVEESFAAGTSPRLKELARQRMLESRSSVLYGDFLACNAFEPPFKEIARFAAPTLMIFGEDDRMVPVRAGRLLQQQLPQSQLEVVASAGHMVMLEQPERVAELMSTFVRGLPYLPGQQGTAAEPA